MRFEKSCGTIVYIQEKDDIRFLSIKHKDGHWCFPKGHVEEGENDKETAFRETLEETGLKVSFLDGFITKIEYSPKNNIRKEVIFFLGSPEKDDVKIQLEELEDYRWGSFQETLDLVTYNNSKDALKKAYSFLKNRVTLSDD